MAKKAEKTTHVPTIKVTMTRSSIGRDQRQSLTLKSMGLRRLNQTVELQDTPAIRGMIAKVSHLVSVSE
jgi:large subunit ribosomal protein L30